MKIYSKYQQTEKSEEKIHSIHLKASNKQEKNILKRSYDAKTKVNSCLKKISFAITACRVSLQPKTQTKISNILTILLILEDHNFNSKSERYGRCVNKIMKRLTLLDSAQMLNRSLVLCQWTLTTWNFSRTLGVIFELLKALKNLEARTRKGEKSRQWQRKKKAKFKAAGNNSRTL